MTGLVPSVLQSILPESARLCLERSIRVVPGGVALGFDPKVRAAPYRLTPAPVVEAIYRRANDAFPITLIPTQQGYYQGVATAVAAGQPTSTSPFEQAIRTQLSFVPKMRVRFPIYKHTSSVSGAFRFCCCCCCCCGNAVTVVLVFVCLINFFLSYLFVSRYCRQ